MKQINDKILKLMAMLMVIFAGATFTACGGDDDDEPEGSGSSNSSSVPSALIGTWERSYQINQGKFLSRYVFKSNGSGSEHYESNSGTNFTYNFTYRYSSSTVYITYTSGPDKGKGEYTLFTIYSLSSTTMSTSDGTFTKK